MCENFIHRCCYIDLSLFTSIIHLEDSWTGQIHRFGVVFNTVSSRKSLDKISQLWAVPVWKNRRTGAGWEAAQAVSAQLYLHHLHLHSPSIGLSALLEFLTYLPLIPLSPYFNKYVGVVFVLRIFPAEREVISETIKSSVYIERLSASWVNVLTDRDTELPGCCPSGLWRSSPPWHTPGVSVGHTGLMSCV